MRPIFTYRNLLEGYPWLLRTITHHGRETAPRGLAVQEHTQPILWHLDRPQEYVLAIPGRRVNPFFAFAEVIWMWTGKGGADFITYYNQSMKQFLDPGIPYFHGAYGRRVRHAGYSERSFRDSLPCPMTPSEVSDGGMIPVEVDQLEHVIRKIQGDADTRQAAVSLWDPIKDNFVSSKDHPCNNMLYFSRRDGALHLTITMRSNDLVWGVPYNMIQFSHLLALMAGSLELEIGSYHVMVNNLHFYTKLYPETLSQVQGWATNVEGRGIDLGAVSDRLYGQEWDMRWTLDGLDNFTGNTWFPLEVQMRSVAEYAPDADTCEAFFSSKWEYLTLQMAQAGVPDYWQNVFAVLFMFHCRKAKAKQTYTQLLGTLPKAMRWMVQDFTKEE